MLTCEICGTDKGVRFHEDTIHTICVDCYYDDHGDIWKDERRLDTLSIIDILRADIAEGIWEASEYPGYNSNLLYNNIDKRLQEVQTRVRELWGK